jgi:hypothetical protein
VKLSTYIFVVLVGFVGGTLITLGCGANKPAIEAAERACLAQDKATLTTKLQQGSQTIEGIAIALTFGEVVCALEGLGAKVPPAPAPAVDAGAATR